MHELAIAASLFDWARDRSRALAPRRLVAIEVERDPLSCLNPEAVAFGFEGLAAGTPLAHVRLDFAPVDPTYVCGVCKTSATSADPPAMCRRCGAPFPRLNRDDSLRVVSIEVDP